MLKRAIRGFAKLEVRANRRSHARLLLKMANESLEELQKAAQELRDGLKNVDEDIKKLTGRDPAESQR